MSITETPAVRFIRRDGSWRSLGGLLEQATAAWSAGITESDGRSLTDLTGQGRHLLPGGVAGATPTSNDPTRLVYDGKRYVWLNGVTGSNATVPAASAFDTEDIDYTTRVAAIDWSNGAIQYLAGHGTSVASGLYRWVLRLTATGNLQAVWSTDAASTSAASTVPLGVADGALTWLRFKLDYNPSGNYIVQFFYSTDDTNEADAVSWTQLGTDIQSAQIAGTRPTETGVTVGASYSGGSSPLAGKVLRAVLRDGLEGAPLLDVDFTRTDLFDAPYTSGTAVTGQTVTLNGRATLVTSTRLFFDGVDDWLQVADDPVFNVDAGTDVTVVAVASKATAGAQETLVASNSGTAATNTGWQLHLNTTTDVTMLVADGANRAFTATPELLAERVTHIVAGVLDRAAAEVVGYGEGAFGTAVSTVSVGGISSGMDLKVGAEAELGGNRLTGEIFGAAIFIGRVLTAVEIAQVGRELAYAEASVA